MDTVLHLLPEWIIPQHVRSDFPRALRWAAAIYVVALPLLWGVWTILPKGMN